MKYDIYLASGWFNENQFNDVENMKRAFEEIGASYYSPKDENLVGKDSSTDEKNEAVKENIRVIKECNLIVVNTRDKDMGTIFEAGYAHAINKRILYYCEGLKGNFNLMLAQSGIAVATSLEQLQEYVEEALKDEDWVKPYVGDIE